MSSTGVDDQVRKKPFTPTPTQKKFLQSTTKQTLLSGSFGAGKSRIGTEKGYLLNLKYPGNRGLIVRNAFTDVWSSTIDQTLLEEVIPDSHIVEHNQTKHKITHFTGTRGPDKEPVTSEIQYHGLDSGGDNDLPTKIGGQQYGWIFVDEGIEISKGAWVQLLGRLRYSGKEMNGRRYEIPFRQIFTATNPASKAHWMYQFFFENNADDKEVFRMTAHELVKHVPQVPSDYVSTMEANYPGVYADRYIHGKWVAASGLVYNEYDPKLHYRTPKDLPGEWTVDARIKHDEDNSTVLALPPDNWRVYRSIDFGYRNPFVCQWIARHPKRDLHVLFREIYRTEELMEDMAVEIKRLSEEMTIEQTYADPAQAEDRATLQRHGVHTTEAKKDISAGIQETKAKLNTEGEDAPKLLFMSGALAHSPDQKLDDEGLPTSTVQEITDYQWKDDKDEPEQEHDHGMDCLRYYVHTISSGTNWTEDEMRRLEAAFNEEGF